MNMRRRGILNIIFFLSVNMIAAQGDTITFYPILNPVMQQYDIHKITTTENGKLWLSVNDGILSWDGNELQAFPLDGLFRYACFQNHKLYLVKTLGLCDFDIRTGKTHSLPVNLEPENSVPNPPAYTQILADSDGTVWAGRVNGFIHYNLSTHTHKFYSVYSNSGKHRIAVNSIISDPRNSEVLWLGTDDGIFKFDKRTHELKRNFNSACLKDSSSADSRVLKIFATNDNSIWFTASGRGIGCYDMNTGKYVIYPFYNGPYGTNEKDLVFFDRRNDDEFYFGASDKMPGVFNKITKRYSFNIKIFNEAAPNGISDLLADGNGNLWCIISGQLYKAIVNQNSFLPVSLNKLNQFNWGGNFFRTIIWDEQEGHYYAVFSDAKKIFVLDSTLRITNTIPVEIDTKGKKRLKLPEIFDLVLDKKGRLWVCGNSLKVFDKIRKKVIPVYKLFPELTFQDQQFQNIVYRNGYLFLQSSDPDNRFIYRINLASNSCDSISIPDDIIPILNKNAAHQKFYQERIVVDKNGKYAYVGIDNYILQINLYTHKVRKVLRVTIRDTKSWYAVDDDDYLWVTSSEGIKIIDPETIRITKKIYHLNSTIRYRMYNMAGFGTMCILHSGGVILYDYRKNKTYQVPFHDGTLPDDLNQVIAVANQHLFVGSRSAMFQHIPLSSVIQDDKKKSCYLTNISLFNESLLSDTLPEYLYTLQLPYNKNFVTLTFSSVDFERFAQVEYRFKLVGVDKAWVYTNHSRRNISYANLKPGNYIFCTSIKNKDGSWHDNETKLHLTIAPAWWQTKWFKIGCVFIAFSLVSGLIHWRIKTVRKQEKRKAKIENEILNIEAKALRAQMNPHFIFNCLNSIKALIQENENEKGIVYLTTFSKLIRTLFNNADKRQISLYDEIETCKLYLQLEAMRFGKKFSYSVNVDQNVDMKSIDVPALIIQPFIENAIWHGIIPKEKGGAVQLTVIKENGTVKIMVEDDGIGRVASQQNKSVSGPAHQSKGINLTQSRLELDNLLRQREAKLEIIDKMDEKGIAGGTTIIITLAEES